MDNNSLSSIIDNPFPNIISIFFHLQVPTELCCSCQCQPIAPFSFFSTQKLLSQPKLLIHFFSWCNIIFLTLQRSEYASAFSFLSLLSKIIVILPLGLFLFLSSATMCVLICKRVFKIFCSHFCIAIFIPLKIVGHKFDVNCSFIGFFFFFFCVFVYNKLYNFCMFINI